MHLLDLIMSSCICLDSKMKKEPPLTDQTMGESREHHPLVYKSFTWKSKRLIIGSCLCVKTKNMKDPPPLIQWSKCGWIKTKEYSCACISKSPEDDTDVNIDWKKKTKHYIRGCRKCGSPPNQPLFLCTCKTPVGKHKKYVPIKGNNRAGSSYGSPPHQPLGLCTWKEIIVRCKVWFQVSMFSVCFVIQIKFANY